MRLMLLCLALTLSVPRVVEAQARERRSTEVAAYAWSARGSDVTGGGVGVGTALRWRFAPDRGVSLVTSAGVTRLGAVSIMTEGGHPVETTGALVAVAVGPEIARQVGSFVPHASGRVGVALVTSNPTFTPFAVTTPMGKRAGRDGLRRVRARHVGAIDSARPRRHRAPRKPRRTHAMADGDRVKRAVRSHVEHHQHVCGHLRSPLVIRARRPSVRQRTV